MQPVVCDEETNEETVVVEDVHIDKKDDDSSLDFEVNGIKFKMKSVVGGTFDMKGTVSSGFLGLSSKEVVQKTTLSNYYIGETQVTQALWQAVMGNNPSHFKGKNKPVECVSWNDCQEFLKELNALTGKTFRLPTEAEWEFAARGGNNSKHTQFSGSNAIDALAWCFANSGGTTHDVATKSPNELGIYDMAGNVWEWCSDWYSEYSSSAQSNPKGPSSGFSRVYRGGSWGSDAGYCRSWYRGNDEPNGRDDDLGFRLALSE